MMIDKLNIPIFQTSVHQQINFDIKQPFVYARSNNPTVEALETHIAKLDATEFGLSFCSGMSAIATLIIALMAQGDHIICDREAYGGTVRLLLELEKKMHISISWVDMRSVHSVESACNNRTRLLFVETPSNPLMSVTDLQLVAGIGRSKNIITVVDNTLLTPVLQQPLKFGADVAVYSTTKYMDGHNAAMGGAITTHQQDLYEKIKFFRNTLGTIQAPYPAWLTLQGLKTLSLRMKAYSASAQIIAQRLIAHPHVQTVYYPELGGVLSFLINENQSNIQTFMASIQSSVIAGSFGSTVSMISHPASMIDLSRYESHENIQFPPDNLIRLSLGLEDPEYIWADLNSALQ